MAMTWGLVRLRRPDSARQGREHGNDARRRARRGPAARIHPAWGYHAEELLFYTSRYYARTEAFLREISGVSGFSFGGFRAQRLTAPQQRAMARLLRRPVGRATARAVIALIRRITLCGGIGRLDARHPGRRSVPLREDFRSQRHRPAGFSATDPFLNIAERFGLPVRQRGRHLWVSFNALKHLLDARSPALRGAVHEAIETLHDGGYHLHRRRSG